MANFGSGYMFFSDTTEALAGAAVDIAMTARPDQVAIHRLNASLVREHQRSLRGAAQERASRTIVHLEMRAEGKAHAW